MQTVTYKTLGHFARAMIVANPNMSNKELLALVQAQYPTNKTTVNCIAWYKADMKKNPTKEVEAKGHVETKRTLEIIELEIMAAEAKLEELREEHKNFKDEEEAAEREELARLQAKYAAK